MNKNKKFKNISTSWRFICFAVVEFHFHALCLADVWYKFVFQSHTPLDDEREVLFKIGDTFVKPFLIDSGSLTNVMSEETFAVILRKSPEAIYDLCFTPTTNLSAYGGHPLAVKCTFRAWVEVVSTNKPKTFAEFVVVGGNSQDLMGYQTSKEMRVARVGLSVNSIESKDQTI